MNQLRLNEKNRIELVIKQSYSSIEINSNTLGRFKMSINHSSLLDNIQKLKVKISSSEDIIRVMENRIKSLQKGELDEELRIKSQENLDYVEAKKIEKKIKKDNIIEYNNKQKEISQAYYQGERTDNREQKYCKKNWDREYKYFMKANDSIPDYILQNLKNMPNNKGYIWRGIWCFGELPEEKNRPVIMTENNKGVSLTHEIYPHEIRIYKKLERNKRELIKTTPRKLIK